MDDDIESKITDLRKRTFNQGPREMQSLYGGKKPDKYWLDQWDQICKKIDAEKGYLFRENMTPHYLLVGVWEYEVMLRATRYHLKKFRAPLQLEEMYIVLVPQVHMLTVVPSPIEYWRNLISLD